MTACIDCKYRKQCSIANDLYILAGIHGIAISIEHCPMRQECEVRFNPGTMIRGTKDGEFAWVCKDCGVPTVDHHHKPECPYFAGVPQDKMSRCIFAAGGCNTTLPYAECPKILDGHLACPHFIPFPSTPQP